MLNEKLMQSLVVIQPETVEDTTKSFEDNSIMDCAESCHFNCKYTCADGCGGGRTFEECMECPNNCAHSIKNNNLK